MYWDGVKKKLPYINAYVRIIYYKVFVSLGKYGLMNCGETTSREDTLSLKDLTKVH